MEEIAEMSEQEQNEMLIREVLVENERRLSDLSDNFNPLTGFRSVGERVKVEIEGFPIRTQWLPVAMMSDPFVIDLQKYGMDGYYQMYFSDLQKERAVEVLIDKFFRIRYRYDFPFWCWMLAKIHPKGSGEDIPFRLNRAQRRLIERFERMRLSGKPIRLVLLKARQWGGSTATQIYMAWLQLVVLKGANSIIVGHVKDASTEVKDMLTKLLDAYDPEMIEDPNSPFFQDKVDDASKNGLFHGTSSSANIFYIKSRNSKFKLGSAEKPNSARGGDSILAHCTEVGLWVTTDNKTPEDIVTSVTGGISYKPNTMIVYESTAKGTGNFFHKTYTTVKRAEEEGTFHQFERMFVNWYEIGWKNMMPFRNDHKYVKKNILSRLGITEEQAVQQVPWFDFYLPEYIPENTPTIEEFARDLVLNRLQNDPPDDTHEPGKYLWRLWNDGATLQGIYWYICERTKYHDHGDMASETPSDDIEAFKHSGAKLFSEYHIAQFKPGCRAPKMTGDVVSTSLKWTPNGLRPGREILQNLKFISDQQGNFRVWRLPEYDGVEYFERPPDSAIERYVKNRYLVVVDIGGTSYKSDWSVIAVFDRYWMMEGGKPELVAEWYGHVHHDLLAWKAAQIAKFYDNALLVIESNTLETRDRDRDVDGNASDFILNQIKECYDNLYERKPDNENIIEGAPHKFGFHTNVKTKVTIILNLQHVIREQLYVERNDKCLNEYMVYEKKPNGSFGAIQGYHDDLLMTRAIGLYICFCEMELPYEYVIKKRTQPLLYSTEVSAASF